MQLPWPSFGHLSRIISKLIKKQIGGYVLISFQRWQFQRRGYKIFGSFLGTRSFSGKEQERAKRAKIVCPPPYQFFTISCMYYGSSVLQLCRQSERSWEKLLHAKDAILFAPTPRPPPLLNNFLPLFVFYSYMYYSSSDFSSVGDNRKSYL